MKKRYSKAFICEAIAYWKKQLRKLNESGQDIYGENDRDEYGFTNAETDVFLFDIVD